MALKIEPGNKVVLEELKKLPPKESKPAGLSSKSTPKTETKPASPKKPSVSISKSPAEEQKEKDQKKGVERRRLSIKVVDEAYSDLTTTTTAAVDNKATTAATPPLPSLASISTTTTTTTTPSSKMDTNAKARTINEQSTKKNIGIQEINNDGNKPVPTLVNPTDTTPKLPPIKFNVPKTNLEFERDWKTCRHRGTDILYQYFQVRKNEKRNEVHQLIH